MRDLVLKLNQQSTQGQNKCIFQVLMSCQVCSCAEIYTSTQSYRLESELFSCFFPPSFILAVQFESSITFTLVSCHPLLVVYY